MLFSRFAPLLLAASLFAAATASAEGTTSAGEPQSDTSSTEAPVPKAARQKAAPKAKDKAPSKQVPQAKVKEEAPKKLRSGRTISVVARDMRLTDSAKERLLHIAARYYEATHKKLVITGGSRTPTRQAELMLQKLKHGEDIVKLYENRRAAGEIRAAYLAGVAQKWSQKRLTRAIRDVIVQQVAQGTYVSRHLQSGAADVRSRDMSVEQEAAFRVAVSAEPGVVLVDERQSTEPHLHLSL